MQETKYLKFSREERVIYRVLENRFRENMNRHFANRTAEKNYATFLVQLLRLRQCTSHPFLLESTVKQLLNLEDIQHLKRQLRQLGRNKRPMYEQIELWVQEGQEEREAGADGKPTPESGEAMPFGQSEFGTYFKMDKFLNGLNDKELMERVVCKICGDLPRDAQITDVSFTAIISLRWWGMKVDRNSVIISSARSASGSTCILKPRRTRNPM